VFGGFKGQYLFTVCDGHGSTGHLVSSFVKDFLPVCIAAKLRTVGAEVEAIDFQVTQALSEAMVETSKKLAFSNIEIDFSGTTCVSVLVRDKHIWCANVGDSRAVVAQKLMSGWGALELSTDHKPNIPEELRRIVMAGGKVEPLKNTKGKPIGPYRVWVKRGSVPGLAMSRSLGDAVAHSVGVTSSADVMHHYISSRDCFMIIASDGLWEFISSLEAVRISSQSYTENNFQGCCDRLMDEAVDRWRLHGGVVDDITIIVVFFKSV
jgi:serine/threonine protein phosphatase PrpC